MSDSEETNSLRIVAALILGIISGVIVFFIIALVLGFIEDTSGIRTGISVNVAENIWSAVLMFIFIIAGMAFFYWKVKSTPASKEEIED
jgi:H+/Cl- antiporter ClcA